MHTQRNTFLYSYEIVLEFKSTTTTTTTTTTTIFFPNLDRDFVGKKRHQATISSPGVADISQCLLYCSKTGWTQDFFFVLAGNGNWAGQEWKQLQIKTFHLSFVRTIYLKFNRGHHDTTYLK